MGSPFFECDIRGIYGEDIDSEFARRLGRVLADHIAGTECVVAGDYRTHTPELMAALVEGLRTGGVQVTSCGRTPTPVYYHARSALGIEAGVMVTASHNPPEYAGFKPILGPLPITPEQIRAIEADMLGASTAPSGPTAPMRAHDPIPAYVASLKRWFSGRLPTCRSTRVVVDIGNGAFGRLAPEVLRSFGLTVHPLFDEPDGRFPNRPSDVAGEAARAHCMAAVVATGAGFGAAYDGDGDRVAFVDNRGRSVPNDVVIALMAEHCLRDAAGAPVVYDVKCSRLVPETVRRCGGVPVVQKSGHTFIKTSMLEHGAVFGGEVSGHLFFGDLHGGDDALYSTLRMAELLIERQAALADLVDAVPTYVTTPDIRLRYEGDSSDVIAAIRTDLEADSACEVITVDGVRAEFPHGWGLIRASVTEPAVTLRFEADEAEALRAVMARFLAAAPELRRRVDEWL